MCVCKKALLWAQARLETRAGCFRKKSSSDRFCSTSAPELLRDETVNLLITDDPRDAESQFPADLHSSVLNDHPLRPISREHRNRKSFSQLLLKQFLLFQSQNAAFGTKIIWNTIWLPSGSIFFKMDQTRPLFVYFCSFHMTNIAQIWL